MIRPGAIVMTVLMSAVAVGVYFGLDYLPQDLVPGSKKPEAGVAIMAPAGPTSETLAEAAPAQTADTSSSAVTEQDLAEEPAPADMDAETEMPVRAASRSLAGAVDVDPSADGEGIPVDEGAPAEPAAQPADKSPAPKSEPTRIARAASPSDSDPARKPVKPKAPEADTIKPWWPDPAKMAANQLKLQYAGQVQNEQAIALLFSAPVNLDTLKKSAEVRNSTGDSVATGQWELANNPRMAVLRGVKPGRYTVILEPTIADDKGYMLGTALQGPVYIQAQ